MNQKNNAYQGSIQQLRFLLFEIGLAFSERDIGSFLLQAEQQLMIELNGLPPHLKTDILPLRRQQLIHQQALSLAYQQQWHQQWRKQTSKEINLWSFLSEKTDFRTLEQWASLGENNLLSRFQHCSEYSLRELMLYEPQFQSQFNLHWCALKKSRFAVNVEWEHQIKNIFPELYMRWAQTLQNQQLKPEHYIPCPVHPAHWRHQLFKHQAQHCQAHDLILLPHFQPVWVGLNQKIYPAGNNRYYFYLKETPTKEAIATLSIKESLNLHCQLEKQPSNSQNNGEILLPFKALSSPSPISNHLLYEDLPNSKALEELIQRNAFNKTTDQSISYLIMSQGRLQGLLFEEGSIHFAGNKESHLKLRAG